MREGIHSESSYMKNPVLHFRVLHEMQRKWEFFHYEDGFLQSVDGRKQSSMCVGILVSCVCFSRVFFIKDENMYGHVKAFQVLKESICQWVITKIRLMNKEK